MSELVQSLAAADGADAAPTEPCRTAARQAEESLAAARAEWNTIEQRDLKKLNDELRQTGVKPLQAPDSR